MSTTSRIPAVKAALLAILQADSGLSGVQVTHGHPGGVLENEAVWIGRAEGRHEPASIRSGRQPRDETFTLDVIVSVLMAGATIAEAETRAHALAAQVEDAIAADVTLGLSPDILWALPGDIEERPTSYETTGVLAEIRLGVEVKARLT